MTKSGLNRRDLLRLGLAAGPAALASACGWDGGELIRPGLAGMSRLNDWVGERILLSKGRLAREYAVSDRTADFPGYFISPTVPTLAMPELWTLDVGGLVRRPRRFTVAELHALPRLNYTVKHHCVEGWTAVGSWSGVPLSALAALVEPTSQARFVRFDSFDRDYFNGWDLASAMHRQTILAYDYNDHPLTPEHGAPLRLYSPIKLGYKLTKYLTKVTFTDQRPGGYWEDQGYPWFGGI